MCGNSLLVNPVYNFKDRSRTVYLPAGTNWYDFYSNKMYAGGQTITAAAPISNIPVFVKEGSMIVTGPVMQYSTEKPADSLHITIYGRKDAAFVLYEDENENYNYENGKYATITFTYKGAESVITIGAPQGNFDGMLLKRKFTITLLDKNNRDKPLEIVAYYTGKEISIPLLK
jgi:alpha-D-xyloside xylohydrolase